MHYSFRIALFLWMIFVANQEVHGQANYHKGMVVTTDGDTLEGFIDDRNWNSNPVAINFKNDLEGTAVVFKPLDINMFEVEGKIYTRAVVLKEISPRSSPFSKTFELNFKTDTAFIQVIFEGIKSLYYYRDKNGRDNFYISTNDEMDLLIYKKYVDGEAGTAVFKENKKFIWQLADYLQDCPAIQSHVKVLGYNMKDLHELFTSYYSCIGKDYEFQDKIEKARVNLGIIGGFNITTLNFESDNFEHIAEEDLTPSNNITLGAFINVVFPKNNDRWTFANELLYNKYSYEWKIEENFSEDYYSTTQYEFSMSYLNVKNMMRYSYPVSDLKLFLNAGISHGFKLGETNYYSKKQHSFGMDEELEGKVLDELRGVEQAILIGLGANLNRFSLEIRKEWGNGMSVYNSLKSATNRTYFLLGIKLN